MTMTFATNRPYPIVGASDGGNEECWTNVAVKFNQNCGGAGKSHRVSKYPSFIQNIREHLSAHALSRFRTAICRHRKCLATSGHSVRSRIGGWLQNIGMPRRPSLILLLLTAKEIALRDGTKVRAAPGRGLTLQHWRLDIIDGTAPGTTVFSTKVVKEPVN